MILSWNAGELLLREQKKATKNSRSTLIEAKMSKQSYQSNCRLKSAGELGEERADTSQVSGFKSWLATNNS